MPFVPVSLHHMEHLFCSDWWLLLCNGPAAGTSKLEALSEEIMKKLMLEPPVEHLKDVLKMPAMILGEKERHASRFESKNALVEDPVAVEKERKTMNPWSSDEKKVFLEKFALYNKNFSKIASHLEYKTTADCVEFYYRNQKSEDFEKIRRRQQLKKRRDYSRASASYLATGLPSSSRQREVSVHARAEALNVQAATLPVSHITVSAKAVRSSMHHKPVERVRVGAFDPASLPQALDSGRLLAGKDSKPVVSTTVLAGTSNVVAALPLSLASVPCSLSSAIPPPVKISRERSSIKTSSGPSVTRSASLEPHISGFKGVRSMHVRRDLAKSAGEEVSGS